MIQGALYIEYQTKNSYKSYECNYEWDPVIHLQHFEWLTYSTINDLRNEYNYNFYYKKSVKMPQGEIKEGDTIQWETMRQNDKPCTKHYKDNL